MSKDKKRKFPFFWVLYALYAIALIAVSYYFLNMLWNFLHVYEQTRPVHAMEANMSILSRAEEEKLRSHLTNTVDNPYEDISVVLNMFYDKIEGKTLSFGKLSGSYSETHPVYAILADEEHVATVSFTMQSTTVDFNLSGWDLESITLLVTPTYSFAVTIPSSMKLFINHIPVMEENIVSTTETDTPVSYVAYAGSGLYEDPVIEVFDRYGTPVVLSKDEQSGGYYYWLTYAYAPSSITLTFGANDLSADHILEDHIPVEALNFLEPFGQRFPEYANLQDRIDMPYFNRYFIDFYYDAPSVHGTDRFGNTVELSYNDTTFTYSHDLISNDALYDECRAYAFNFVEQYDKVCLNDAKIPTLKPYFPENSEYYELISNLSNVWTSKHSKLTFENETVEEFFAYSDDLVFIHVSMDQKMLIASTGKYSIVHVDMPLWLVKLDGSWYIGMISFDNINTELPE